MLVIETLKEMDTMEIKKLEWKREDHGHGLFSLFARTPGS
jgi:hypothetical protein